MIEDMPLDRGAARRRSLETRAAPPPRQRTENEIVTEVIQYLRALPNAHARKQHGSAMTQKGEPDVDACVRGRAVKLEAKRPGNKPTPAQREALARWGNAGALMGWFTDLSHVRALLDHLDDPDYRADLDHPGCRCPVHRDRS